MKYIKYAWYQFRWHLLQCKLKICWWLADISPTIGLQQYWIDRSGKYIGQQLMWCCKMFELVDRRVWYGTIDGES